MVQYEPTILITCRTTIPSSQLLLAQRPRDRYQAQGQYPAGAFRASKKNLLDGEKLPYTPRPSVRRERFSKICFSVEAVESQEMIE